MFVRKSKTETYLIFSFLSVSPLFSLLLCQAAHAMPKLLDFLTALSLWTCLFYPPGGGLITWW